ncbi:MAG: FeoA domain-containing protein [Anaerolineales bacterium]|nr:FeoA domain-containing protein [Anaerolineales bacterium]
MGIIPGVHFEIVHDHASPLLLALRSARLALGCGMTNQILVEATRRSRTPNHSAGALKITLPTTRNPSSPRISCANSGSSLIV